MAICFKNLVDSTMGFPEERIATSDDPRYYTPRLMVSDNPETVHPALPADAGVLWQHTVQNDVKYRHRVFIWHVNRTIFADTVALTFANNSDRALTVRTRPWYATTADKYQEWQIGSGNARCLLIGGPPPPPGIITVQPGTIETLVELPWPIVTPPALLGAQVDVNIRPSTPGPINYRLRTVYGPSGTDFRTLTGAPPTLEQPHPRGGVELVRDIHGDRTYRG